jgi:hypothetical protein
MKTGLSSIPDISWYSREDLSRWIEWLNFNDIHTISITLQCITRDSKSLLHPLIDDLKLIKSSLERDIQLVFVGGNNAMRDLIPVFGNISLINFQPFVKAFFGRKIFMREGKFDSILLRSKSKEDIFYENLKLYKNYINSYITSCREETIPLSMS